MKKRYLLPIALFLAVGVFVPRGEVAADCTNWYGDSRPCTQTEQFDLCIEYAIEAADWRAEEDDDSALIRFLWFNVDVAACTASLILPFV
jgi:hypothetical protein